MSTIRLKLEEHERKHCHIMIDYKLFDRKYTIYNVYFISKSNVILQISLNQYSIFKQPHLSKTSKEHLDLFAIRFLPDSIRAYLLSTNSSVHICLLNHEKEEIENKIIRLIERKDKYEIQEGK